MGTQIGIYMQVHGMDEARTHIIIDYNRNGIVNQIALNGTDFKMGFIIAGVGADAGTGAGALAPLELLQQPAAVAIVGGDCRRRRCCRRRRSDIQCHNL